MATPLDPTVARVFAAYPRSVRVKLLALRALIFAVARRTPEAGALRESLKWGQPSYATEATGSGSPLRIDALRAVPGGYALYFHCQTTLVDSIRRKFGDRFRYEGNRALHFAAAERLPRVELGECIAMALTYHSSQRPPRTPIGLRIK